MNSTSQIFSSRSGIGKNWVSLKLGQNPSASLNLRDQTTSLKPSRANSIRFLWLKNNSLWLDALSFCPIGVVVLPPQPQQQPHPLELGSCPHPLEQRRTQACFSSVRPLGLWWQWQTHQPLNHLQGHSSCFLEDNTFMASSSVSSPSAYRIPPDQQSSSIHAHFCPLLLKLVEYLLRRLTGPMTHTPVISWVPVNNSAILIDNAVIS